MMAMILAATLYTTAGLDHILIGVPNLDDGIRAFEQATGVTPVRGGKHPSRGTENALVSLGRGAYIEIIAPQADAAPNEMVTQLRALHGPTLVGWAVHVAGRDDRRLRAGRPHSRMRGMRIKPTILILLLSVPLAAQDFARDVDKAVAEALARTGAPSASVAIVKDGKIAYVHAYGNARLDPPMAATPDRCSTSCTSASSIRCT